MNQKTRIDVLNDIRNYLLASAHFIYLPTIDQIHGRLRSASLVECRHALITFLHPYFSVSATADILNVSRIYVNNSIEKTENAPSEFYLSFYKSIPALAKHYFAGKFATQRASNEIDFFPETVIFQDWEKEEAQKFDSNLSYFRNHFGISLAKKRQNFEYTFYGWITHVYCRSLFDNLSS